MAGHGRTVQVNGRSFSLTPMEYDVFRRMQIHRGEVVSREMLLRQVWGFPDGAETRSLDMCIRRLRAKIGRETIRTVHGEGYMLMA